MKSTGIATIALALAAGLLLTGPVPGRAAVRKVFHKPFTNNDEVRKMVVFGNALYAAVGARRPKDTMRVYRSEHIGCKLWDDVTPLWETDPNTSVLAFGIYDGKLYLGTSAGLYRTATGKSWEKVPIIVGGIPEAGDRFGDMIVYQGSLWIVGSGIYRYNGTTWSNFGFPSYYSGFDAGKFAILNQKLYLGLGRDNNNGISIYRTNGAKGWDLFHEVPSGPGHVWGMHVFKGHLYIGEYHGMDVFRTNGAPKGSPGHWEESSLPEPNPFDFSESAGVLYVSSFNLTGDKNGLPLVYSSKDGTTWNAVPNLVGASTMNKGAVSLADYNGRLYVGTFDLANGGEIFEVGNPLSNCTIAGLTNKSVLHESAAWLLIRKDELKFQKASALGSPGNGWSGELLDDLAVALAELPVPAGDQEMKDQARERLQVAIGHAGLMSATAQASVTIEDPQDRLPLVQAAEAHLADARSGFDSFRDSLGQLACGGNPTRFEAGFDQAESPWELQGAVELDEYLGEPAFHAFGKGTAKASLAPFAGDALVGFSMLIETGACRVTFGSRRRNVFSLVVTPAKATLRQSRAGRARKLARVALPTPASRWRHFQVIKEGRELQVYWDGRRIMRKRIGQGPMTFAPRIQCGAGTEAWLDDFVIAQPCP